MMVNINAFCLGYMGVQKHGSSFMRALSRHLDIALFPWDPVPAPELLSRELRDFIANARGRDVESNTGIGIGVMNRMPHVVGNRKIAYTVWETSRIPEPELAHLNRVDEIWMPSSWGKSMLEANGIAPDRIAVVPEGVDVDVYRPIDVERATSGRFRLLCIGKWEKRKGIDILLRAYASAFDADDPVELVLHCHNANRPGLDIKTLANAILPDPHPPVVFSGPIPEAKMPALYNSCDAFVLATRAEGWGLPVIEAMACAKPVIVTGYGGHLDFVNERNAYVIAVKRMVDVDDEQNFDASMDFGQWAEPDEEHLAWLLHHIFENRAAARRIGQVARDDVAGTWTWGHAADKALELL